MKNVSEEDLAIINCFIIMKSNCFIIMKSNILILYQLIIHNNKSLQVFFSLHIMKISGVQNNIEHY